VADHTLTLSLVLPPVELDAVLDYQGPRTTDVSNAFDGAENGGGAIVTKEPPVAAPPLGAPAPPVEKATAFPLPTLVKGQPTSEEFTNMRALVRPGYVNRVIVGGRVISDFRVTAPGDQPIQMPGYTLMEPFGYGSSNPLRILRTNCLFERYGTGSLAWLHQGAPVRYQRIYNPGTEDQVIITDYRGVVTAVTQGGPENQNNWVAQVGGEVSARINAEPKPAVKYRKIYDIGHLMGAACDHFGIRLVPPNGPTTGIRYPEQGGLTWGSWMTNLGALTRTENTQQRVLMPYGTWGGAQYAFVEKDVETVHATMWTDGSRVASRLTDDALEQPNIVYGNWTDPNGERGDGSVYPGVVQGPPGAYPFNNHATTFTIGDTDADTDTGFGISALRLKLAWDGLLANSARDGDTFDAEVGRAVRLLKIAAGMTADAVMTYEAWNVLWDVGVVGYSLAGARILPLAQSNTVNPYILTPGGSVVGRNPNHIHGILRVGVSYDYGVVDEDRARQHARAVVKAGSGHQWAGSVTMDRAHAFAGDLDDADIPGLTADDMMSARDIRPGMNIKLPHLEGGTVLHIAQVTVTPADGGDTVELTGDTGYRDVFDLSQALDRNVESRRSPYREFVAANRGWKPPGNLTTRDRFFGKTYQDVKLRGGRWNQVPFIMGQQGTVGRTDIRLANLVTEHCGAVFVKPVSPANLQRLVGDPFAVDENGQTGWEREGNDFLFDQRTLLYLYGQGAQPGGYGWKKGYYSDEEHTRTPNPLTGQHLDDASWPYVTAPAYAPLAFFLVYPKRSCTLKRGRLFYALEDDVT
jgi:hypothetical protein